jgi:endonuclease YncB( thermonuclease family)
MQASYFADTKRAIGALRLFVLVAAFCCFRAGASHAADAVVKDGNTLQLDGMTYRLDGIDAPERDQICINEYADPSACGTDAREQLISLIGKRGVHCEDRGPDKGFRRWHLGTCTADGESLSLNQQLVQKGFALDVETGGKFKADETAAKDHAVGLWKGCFAAPSDFRRGDKTRPLLGAACRTDKDREIRAVLFPTETVAPPGCVIKGKFAVRARVTGNVGVYLLQSCRTYETLIRPERWFCSEEDAQAAGFRKAFTCPVSLRRK